MLRGWVTVGCAERRVGLQANYELLLSIFNPEGWLDTTYVDDQHRIGRDDKGNVFVLERC